MKKKLKVTFRGFPWQKFNDREKFGWNPLSVKGSGRYGGCWAFKLGITSSRRVNDVVIDVGLGSIRIQYK